MNDKCTRLCGQERKVIAAMAQAGKTQNSIAQAIGRCQGTISKELRRNRGQRGYRPLQADGMAKERKAGKRSRPKVMVGLASILRINRKRRYRRRSKMGRGEKIPNRVSQRPETPGRRYQRAVR